MRMNYQAARTRLRELCDQAGLTPEQIKTAEYDLRVLAEVGEPMFALVDLEKIVYDIQKEPA